MKVSIISLLRRRVCGFDFIVSANAPAINPYLASVIAAKLAVGYTLDEILNDITGVTPACFEPALDYVVVKMPRWAFEKFPGAPRMLGTAMKSVGEVMAIGRTFKESFLKAMRSRELDAPADLPAGKPATLKALAGPTPDRYDLILHALRQQATVPELQAITGISGFFLSELHDLVELERDWAAAPSITSEKLRAMKRYGFPDARLGELRGRPEAEIRALRTRYRIRPTYKAVDTCSAEFEARTPYFYSTYEDENEAAPGDIPRVVILGSGPNRIGQGIEFDYCCVHAAMSVREAGYEAVMVNCNPETVSTDYDVSSRLYFEPLTAEDVLNVVENEQPLGVILQFGGQTPLRLAAALSEAGVALLGTPGEAIQIAEDRGRFGALLDKAGMRCPAYGVVGSLDEARAAAARIGYPVLVRPSFVLGGRAMQVVYDEQDLASYLDGAMRANPERPVLIDRFLENAIEVDVDAVADGEDVYIGAVMQHVEEAGVHSGDSACVIPSISLGEGTLEQVRQWTTRLALALGVRGLLNLQFAYQDYGLYVLEANPRASRTVPFVSKATGIQLARIATRVILGERLSTMGLPERLVPGHVSVKEVVTPFRRFPESDSRLGPEMKSTGEVMGVADSFPSAFAKAQAAAGAPLPEEGVAFLSVCDTDKSAATILAQRLVNLGFTVRATAGTARALQALGVPAEPIAKVAERTPNVVDLIEAGEVALVVNTPYGRGARSDGAEIRRAALRRGVPCITTLAGAAAAVSAIEASRRPRLQVRSLQELHGMVAARTDPGSIRLSGRGEGPA